MGCGAVGLRVRARGHSARGCAQKPACGGLCAAGCARAAARAGLCAGGARGAARGGWAQGGRATYTCLGP